MAVSVMNSSSVACMLSSFSMLISSSGSRDRNSSVFDSSMKCSITYVHACQAHSQSYLIFYAQSAAKSHIGRNKRYFSPPQVQILIHLLHTHSTIEDLEEMKWNEPGRQKLGRHRSPVRRHNFQSSILTCYMLRKREPLIALGSHQGSLISASTVPYAGAWQVLDTAHHHHHAAAVCMKQDPSQFI